MNKSFTKALQTNSLDDIVLIPKSDLHSHAGRGGNVKYLSAWAGKKIPLPPAKFQSLADMQEWYSNNIRYLSCGVEGQIKRWEACFKQACDDNITVLALSFSVAEIELVGGIDNFIELVTK